MYERALTRIGDPRFAQATWTDGTRGLAEVHFAQGKWAHVQNLINRLTEVPAAPGGKTIGVAELAGRLACHRGDTETAQQWLDIATTHVPPNEDQLLLITRVVYRYLRSQVAIAQGDLPAARAELAPLWNLDGGASRIPSIWMPLLLAAKVEADLGDGRGEPPGDAAVAAATAIRAIADRVPQHGLLADAWSAHLDAELVRADGGDDVTAWSEVVEAWRRAGHIPYQAYALTRLGAQPISPPAIVTPQPFHSPKLSISLPNLAPSHSVTRSSSWRIVVS